MRIAAVDAQPEDLRLPLPVSAKSIGIARRVAVRYAEQAGCDPATCWRVRLAVSEAVSNVVLHAHRTPGPEDEPAPLLVLVGDSDEQSCTFTVDDDGVGLQARSESPGLGLGLALIANACDALDLHPGRDGGTRVRMTFRI